MSEPTKPQRDKYRFVPIGYFIGGFCSSLSGMLYLTEGYLTVNFASLGVIPIWMFSKLPVR